MANGKKGDHPVTDIVDWGLEVYGDPIDAMIRELDEAGRGYDLNEIQFWCDPAPEEIQSQLRAIADRPPSARVVFYFEPRMTERFGFPGPGWFFRGAVQFVDPDESLEETWTVVFFPDPIHLEDGRIVATARPVSNDAPPGFLAPGREFWIRSARTKLARGRVLREGEKPL